MNQNKKIKFLMPNSKTASHTTALKQALVKIMKDGIGEKNSNTFGLHYYKIL